MPICRGTDAHTDGRTENIYSIFRDKLLLLGEHVFVDNIRQSCFVFGWNKTRCLSIVSDGNFFLSTLY